METGAIASDDPLPLWRTVAVLSGGAATSHQSIIVGGMGGGISRNRGSMGRAGDGATTVSFDNEATRRKQIDYLR